ncbi:MAG TPA: DoxX family protein [Terriglobales bacterium]|nr:DoxX family protein [Terriglobales bacterium]
MFALLKKAYIGLAAALDRTQSLFILAVRLYWGWQLAQNGWGKLHGIERVSAYFQSLNVPAPQATAVMVSSLEFVGGILLILGLGSRLIAIPLTVNMLAAYYFGDREALFSIFTEPGKFYAADPYTFLFASAFILIFGAGVFSLDYLLFRRSSAQGDERRIQVEAKSLIA